MDRGRAIGDACGKEEEEIRKIAKGRSETDPLFGAIMHRVHGGCPTVGDIATLNSRVLNGGTCTICDRNEKVLV